MGAPFRKPTGFMTVNVPLLRTMVRQMGAGGYCDHGPQAHSTLQGINDSGEWRTAPAKEYASGVCRTLASALLASLSRWPQLGGDPRDHSGPLDYLFQPLDPYVIRHRHHDRYEKSH